MRRFVELLLAAGLGVAGTYWYVKEPRRRHRRHEHFLTRQSGATLGISPDLLFTVHVLLQHALDERKRPVWRTSENHATAYAPTIVVMIATAMDAWLSELIAFARHPLRLPEKHVASVIDIGTTSDKYESCTELLLGRKLRANADLRTLSKPATRSFTSSPTPRTLLKRPSPNGSNNLSKSTFLSAQRVTLTFTSARNSAYMLSRTGRARQLIKQQNNFRMPQC